MDSVLLWGKLGFLLWKDHSSLIVMQLGRVRMVLFQLSAMISGQLAHHFFFFFFLNMCFRDSNSSLFTKFHVRTEYVNSVHSYRNYPISYGNSVFHLSLSACMSEWYFCLFLSMLAHLSQGSPLKYKAVVICVPPPVSWRQKFQLHSSGLKAKR